jgi:hypothetical protein
MDMEAKPSPSPPPPTDLEFLCFKCGKYDRTGIKRPIKVLVPAERITARKTKNDRYQLVGKHKRHYVYKFATRDQFQQFRNGLTT